jgi:tetratricopeptide (TPR) repeat protein
MMKTGMLVCILAICAAAQSPQSEGANTNIDAKLTIHTLVREDIFAGVLTNDMERLARGEKSVDRLLQSRDKERAPLLAWKGEIELYRAVIASEQHRDAEWNAHFKRALDLFAEAKKLAPDDVGVNAVTGGTWLIFINRLPAQYQAAANASAYEAYRAILNSQGKFLEHLPSHIKGELLGGLAESSQRTGHTEEAAKYLDQIIAQMPGSAYATRAEAWKKDPSLASHDHVTCQSCHEPGRLVAARAALAK